MRRTPTLRFIEGEDGGQTSAEQDETTHTQESQGGEKPADDDKTDWRAEARKWEKRAKDNKSAAEKLKELEDAGKSEADKASEELAAARRRAEEAEQSVSRFRIAAKYKLDDSDVDLLSGDEEQMEKLAARLAATNSPKPPRSAQIPDSSRDRTPPAPTLKDGAELFGRVKENLY